ncbi:MAG: hypothetical protein ACFB20_10080 [Opitutales bacterium]
MDLTAGTPFYLFGAGSRSKYIYREGKLIKWPEQRLVFRGNVLDERIYPAEHRVQLVCEDDTTALIEESERGLFLKTDGPAHLLATDSVKMPDFSEHRFRDQLRILHFEILWNIKDGRPLANLLAYTKPSYREAASIAMVLKLTGNLPLIADWIESITEPFDLNNGTAEADNLGQVLFLNSLLDERNDDLVDKALDQMGTYVKDGIVRGRTDSRERPVYQSLWLKYGLQCLGLKEEEEKVQPPVAEEDYRHLFWWDLRDVPDPAADRTFFNGETNNPYRAWAEANYLNTEPPRELAGRNFPLSYEASARQADVNAMRAISEDLADSRIVTPHSRHAAEMFLYYWHRDSGKGRKNAVARSRYP